MSYSSKLFPLASFFEKECQQNFTRAANCIHWLKHIKSISLLGCPIHKSNQSRTTVRLRHYVRSCLYIDNLLGSTNRHYLLLTMYITQISYFTCLILYYKLYRMYRRVNDFEKGTLYVSIHVVYHRII